MSWNFTLRLPLVVAALAALPESMPGARAAQRISDDYAIREWHAPDGLPSEQITRINQDGEGYLWVATTSGMARFDGAHFTEYPLTTDSASYTRVTVSSATRGLIAAPFSRRGLVALENGAFRPWQPEEFQARAITALFAERGGALWMACDDGTVVRHEGGRSRVFSSEDGLLRARVRTFASDASGQVWIASDGFVARYQEGELIPLADNFGGSELRIGSSETGGPWLVTRDRLMRFDGDRAVEVAPLPLLLGARSEERRVGKECPSKCRSRWSPYH